MGFELRTSGVGCTGSVATTVHFSLMITFYILTSCITEATYQPALQQFQRGWGSNPRSSVSKHAFEEGEREERGAGEGDAVQRRVGVGVDKKEVDEKVQVEAKKRAACEARRSRGSCCCRLDSCSNTSDDDTGTAESGASSGHCNPEIDTAAAYHGGLS